MNQTNFQQLGNMFVKLHNNFQKHTELNENQFILIQTMFELFVEAFLEQNPNGHIQLLQQIHQLPNPLSRKELKKLVPKRRVQFTSYNTVYLIKPKVWTD
jgi:hypothetical protein